MGSSAQRIRIPLRESIHLIFSYARTRIGEQIPSVLFISAYLIVFQVFVLGLPIADALVLAAGLAMVISGLAFFLEGLALGLMPLGETIGLKLPKRAPLPVVLIFAFLLGVGATLAEPAVGALRIAGESVKAWDAPLLFLILNNYSTYLVVAIGLGVGFAVCLGMFRFYYNWSLKPLIFILMGILIPLTIYASLNPKLTSLTGLAWDSGGITTGPVTVPLVIALGLGITRVVSKSESALSGFGVVTLASAVPIIAVFGLGIGLLGSAPLPMNDQEFASSQHRAETVALFGDEAALKAYVIAHGSPQARLELFSGDTGARDAWFRQIEDSPELRRDQFGNDTHGFQRWLVSHGSPEEQNAFYHSPAALASAKQTFLHGKSDTPIVESLGSIGLASIQAVLPLCLFLLLTLVVFLREKLPRPDEVLFGIAVALLGMFLLNGGISFGLSRLGTSVGAALPATVKAIDLPDETLVIPGFTKDNVYRSVDPNGTVSEFFYLHQHGQTREIPFVAQSFHPDTETYDLVQQRGPLLGPRNEGWGLLVLLLFAFVMGYGATMAEPALITMGRTVEEITVGIFRKTKLMRAVAFGVGIGMMFGVLKIVWNLNLAWLLIPPYLVVLVLTILSDENYVSIAWDSAGVTTGPVTVPLVLAMGLGLATNMGVSEGFGILAMASVWPILSVLSMGLFLKYQQRMSMRAVEGGPGA